MCQRGDDGFEISEELKSQVLGGDFPKEISPEEEIIKLKKENADLKKEIVGLKRRIHTMESAMRFGRPFADN
ncbi:MAG: hypothetical protein ABIJ82_03870 [Patescibacteria group bacterium]